MRRSRQERLEGAREMLGSSLGRAAHGGTTSPPSRYPQPGVRQTEALTGARLITERGWVRPVAVSHLCYPPQQYPDQCGPGSQWQCACAAFWVAQGVAVHKYPVGVGQVARDVILGPEYWTWMEGTGSAEPENYRAQQAYWDWRPAADKILEHLRGQQP